MKSIRGYLLSRLLGGAAMILAAAAAVVYVFGTRALEASFDRNLTDEVQGFASILFQDKDHVELEFSGQLMPEYERDELPEYFDLRFSDGRDLERSESLHGASLSLQGSPTEEAQHWSAPLPDGRPGRFVSQLIEVHHVFPEEGPNRPKAATVLVILAQGREDLASAERSLLTHCVVVSCALLGLLGFLSRTAVDRGLQPANRLAATLDAIDVRNLPASLDVGDLPLELAPVGDKCDALIRRVDAALKRERRTTADIAHELRTPISELLTVSEVALRNGRDARGANEALATVRNVSWRMGRSVSTLLKLARLDMGAESFAREAVDLGLMVQELLRSLASLEMEGDLRVHNRVLPGERVEGDPDVLRIIVSNLLSNALYYTPERGAVACRLDRSEIEWTFVVENDAIDARADDARAVFDPLSQGDRARSDRNRSGLGLALSRALAHKAGLELTFEVDAGRFRASLAARIQQSSVATPG